MNQLNRILTTITLSTLSTWGANSVRLNPGVTMSNFSAPLVLNDYRIELRLHDLVKPTSNTSFIFLLNWAGIGLIASPNNTITVINYREQVVGGNQCAFSMDGRGDTLLRIQRDATNLRFTCEMWNANGSGYKGLTANIASLGNTLGTDAGMGGPETTVSVGFLRVLPGVLPVGSILPLEVETSGSLAQFAFETNIRDGSSFQRHWIGSAPLVASPVLVPAVIARTLNAPGWSDWTALRAGRTNFLDGTRSVSVATGSNLTYQWQQVSGPSQIQWVDRTAAKPEINGLIFGTYTVALEVTDQEGSRSRGELTFGAVAVDQNDVVIYANPLLNKILGPMLRFGADPWPWADNRHQFLSEYFGNLIFTEPAYGTYWDIPNTGTVSINNGGTIVTGQGTNFLSLFACNGSYGDNIVIWYDRADGGTGRAEYDIASCQSNTQLTIRLAFNYPTATARNYTRPVLVGNYGPWAESNNFYDNVLAHYAMYYRSGNEKYLNFARVLADRFWRSPPLDEGNFLQFPRRRSLTGLVLRALDGRPEMWNGLRKIIESDYNPTYAGNIVSAVQIGDVREDAYRLNEVALGVLADPDAGKRAQNLSALTTALNVKWIPQQKPDGNFIAGGPPYGPQVQLSNGSAIVQILSGTFSPTICGSRLSTGIIVVAPRSKSATAGSGTTFTNALVGGMIEVNTTKSGLPYSFYSLVEAVNSPSSLTLRTAYDGDPLTSNNYVFFGSGDLPWLTFAPQYGIAANFDPVFYTCAYNSPTQLTLDRPYEGSSTPKYIHAANLLGIGTQPFIMGVVASSFRLVYEATGIEAAKRITVDSARWLKDKGYWSERKGLYYGRVHVGCEPDPQRVINCEGGGQSPEINRAFSGEVYGGLAAALLWDPNPQLANVGDALYAGNFGKFGGPSTEERYYNSGLDDSGFSVITKKAKDYGFSFGFGGAWRWPAARQGTPQSALPTDIPITFNMADIAGTTTVAVRLTAPNGIQSDFGCTESPCTINLDRRMGSHIYKLFFLGADNRVLGESDPMILRLD